jgi:Arc/MetJ-type ribon-helix-helix transcriptional regulator
MATTQIAVRLPDSLVNWIDEQVTSGEASRALVVKKALMRYRRQVMAEHDAEIYRRTGDYEDLEGLAEWAAHHLEALD